MPAARKPQRWRARLRFTPLRSAGSTSKTKEKTDNAHSAIDNPHRRCSAWLGRCFICVLQQLRCCRSNAIRIWCLEKNRPIVVKPLVAVRRVQNDLRKSRHLAGAFDGVEIARDDRLTSRDDLAAPRRPVPRNFRRGLCAALTPQLTPPPLRRSISSLTRHT